MNNLKMVIEVRSDRTQSLLTWKQKNIYQKYVRPDFHFVKVLNGFLSKPKI